MVGNSKEKKDEFKQFEKRKIKERNDISQSNNARRTMLNDQRNKKEEIKFDLQQKLTHAKYDIDNATKNAKIFDEVFLGKEKIP